MNILGVIHAFRVIREPGLCLPHATVSTFKDLPIPLNKAFTPYNGQKSVDIRAVVLDKDNCFAVPHQNLVHEPYSVMNSISSLLLRCQRDQDIY